MRCTEITELADLYVDGELSEETRGRIDRHILRCADCAYRIRAIEQTKSLLRDAYPRAETSPGFRERTSARLHDAFADVLRREPQPSEGQWTLPFRD
jgi:anti-sigma factor RsiW